VSKLKKDHIVEVKSLPNPPRACVIILGGMVILLQDKIKNMGGDIIIRNVEGQIGKKEEDYFNTAKKYLLNDPKELLDMLRLYDKDNINQRLIEKLESKILHDPDFQLERAKTCSFAVKFLFMWCRAMYDYNKIFLETQPIRSKLKSALAVVAEKSAQLKVKKDMLD
jgi:dynein heavy chain